MIITIDELTELLEKADEITQAGRYIANRVTVLEDDNAKLQYRVSELEARLNSPNLGHGAPKNVS